MPEVAIPDDDGDLADNMNDENVTSQTAAPQLLPLPEPEALEVPEPYGPLRTSSRRSRPGPMAGATYLAEYAEEICQSWITYAWLTGRSRRKELTLANLTKMERTLFDASMAKEWDNWKNFMAVTVVTGKEAKELLEKAKPIPSRWVHTNKNEFDPKLPMQAVSRLLELAAMSRCMSERTRLHPHSWSST